MKTCLKVRGQTRRLRKEDGEDITCFVAYSDSCQHQEIVENYFQYHLSLDLEYMKKHHSSHFVDPQNIAHAILLYHFFREKHLYFEAGLWEYIADSSLPNRKPENEGEDFSLWVDPQNGSRIF